VTIISEDKN